MQKLSSCPVCDVSVQNTTEDRCPDCQWILSVSIDSILDREKYNRLIELVVDYHNQVKELQSRGDYKDRVLKHRLDTQRDDINLLKSKMDKLLIQPELPAPTDLTVVRSIEDLKDNPTPATLIPEILSTENQNSNSPLTDEVSLADNSEDLEPNELSVDQNQIVSDYYHNPSDFYKEYDLRIATITSEVSNNNLTSKQKELILTEADRGNYWIFEMEDTCYLVPYYGKYFNQDSYQALSIIFECENYTPDYESIQLLSAAIVTSENGTSPQIWRLKQQGQLFFK